MNRPEFKLCLSCGCKTYGHQMLCCLTPVDAQAQKLELARLRNALDDAVALLRDWEDYDVGDRECMWPKRRDEFLAEHEEDGR